MEAAGRWESAFLTLSGVQGGPHCITLGASVPGFAASWAPRGGTLPVFQQTINYFTLLTLIMSVWISKLTFIPICPAGDNPLQAPY